METQNLFLIDGYNLIFRSYFAFIRAPLRNKAGENTSAIFGFLRTLAMLVRTYNPEYVVVLFDSISDTYRNKLSPEYKATRDRTPADLKSQIPQVEEILVALGIPTVRVEGYEADDLIATYSKACQKYDWMCAIISSDKDLMQLVNNKTYILKPSSSGFAKIDTDGVVAAKGVTPEQIADYLVLLGDAVDNIAGVPGIGKSTGAKLLNTYENIEAIYEHIDELRPAQKKAFLENKENVELSRKLIKLQDDAPLPQPLDKLSRLSLDFARAHSLFMKHDMHSLMEELQALSVSMGNAAESGIVGDGMNNVDDRIQKYQLVTTPTELADCLRQIREQKICAVDIETDNLNPMRANPIGFSFAIKDGKAWYIPHKGPDGIVFDEQTLHKELANVLEDESIALVGQNIKYDLKVLRRWGVHANNVVCDTMVAAWLLDTTLNAFSLDNLAKRYLHYKTIPFPDIAKKLGFESVPLDEAYAYAAEDADVAYRLYEQLTSQLKQDTLRWKLFQEVEMALIPILTEMEFTGIFLHISQLSDYGKKLRSEIEILQKEIHEIVGHNFNINSTKQLQRVLFEELKLDPIKKTKTGFSTDTHVLQLLTSKHPLPGKILHYRQLSKLLSTYVETLPQLVNPHSKRIHTTFNLTGTATGRISSNDPNLQNIPIRDAIGREIRSAFVPMEGHRFVSADYSQIELVIFAHLSGDKALREAFSSQIDIHNHTGSLIFGVPPDQIDSKQRRIAKTINFGVMYGMSAFRLARELGISMKDAEMFIARYFETYIGVQEYMQEIIKNASQEGGVRTIMGRWRDIPEINSENKFVREGAKRIAVNTPIQGSAADIIKLSMINVHKRIQREQLKSSLLLQVHDELLVEAPIDEVEAVSTLLREEMCNSYVLSVPLKVDISVGDSWDTL